MRLAMRWLGACLVVVLALPISYAVGAGYLWVVFPVPPAVGITAAALLLIAAIVFAAWLVGLRLTSRRDVHARRPSRRMHRSHRPA